MNLELHILQSFAPSNLNRDDTGSPKDCDFGAVRRARISSQCLKRSIRLAFERMDLLPENTLGVRTRRIASRVAEILEKAGKKADDARAVADRALGAVGLGAGKNGDSEYLLFVPKTALDQFAKTCLAHWDDLQPKRVADPPKQAPGKQAKKAEPDVPAEVKAALENLFHAGPAADLALFGRMIADRPNDNVVAATQVAHAISTHKVDLEFDFYTAVDDLQPDGETGAGMMGTVEYNAACFYRYANIDLVQLLKNVDGDRALAHDALDAFLRAAVEAVPSGKQNSMAAQNPPSFILVVLRERGFWSLANAFLKPVRPGTTADLMAASITALDGYWSRLTEMYGKPVGAWLGMATLHPEAAVNLSAERKAMPVCALIQAAAERASDAWKA